MRFGQHLVVFARAPRLGAVKRRLAADIGDVAAWQFYRRTLARVLRRVAPDPRWRSWLAVTPDRFASASGIWCLAGSRPPRLIPQGAGDIGQRMARPLADLPPGPVVIVGCDIPDLDRAHIARAFAALGRHDAVFGPAEDGGYWLVGARRRPRVPDLFARVRWSSPLALADTRANLAPGQSAVLIDLLRDIDDGAAYAAWRRKISKSPGAPGAAA